MNEYGFTVDGILDMDLEWLISVLNQLAVKYGYLGAFFLALVSNLILFVPVPYLAVFFLLGESPDLDFWILSIVGGAGAAVGKLLSYLVGLGGREIVSEERQRRFEALKRLIDRYGLFIVIVVTATPMPDDIFLIPFGMIRYSLLKYFAGCFLGKVLITATMVGMGRVHHEIMSSLGLEQGIAISIIGFIIIMALIFGIDWEKVLRETERGGFVAGIVDILQQFRRLLDPRRLYDVVKSIGRH